MPAPTRQNIRCATLGEWRQWLWAHNGQTDFIFLEYPRGAKGGMVSKLALDQHRDDPPPGPNTPLTMGEAVSEALAWGWIDSVPQKRDDAWTAVMMSPRRPDSGWSGINKKLIARLERQGRMQPPGLAKIEEAKRRGTWTLLDGPTSGEIPLDLADALAAVGLHDAFESLPISRRRPLLEQIALARQPDTRARRIEAVVTTVAALLEGKGSSKSTRSGLVG